MVRVSVSADVSKAKRELSRTQRKQVPFALSRALNDLGFEARKEEVKAVDRHIDRPTSFTKKGFQVIKSTKRKLVAFLEIPANRWKYMKFPVEGGSQSRNHAIPVNRKTNKFGGLTKANRGARKGEFVATINGVSGAWKREKGGRLRLMVLYKDTVTKRAIYPFGDAGAREVKQKFASIWRKNIAQALRTAR